MGKVKEDILYCMIFKTILDIHQSGDLSKLKVLRQRLLCDGVDASLIYRLTQRSKCIVGEGRYAEINKRLEGIVLVSIMQVRYSRQTRLNGFDYVRFGRNDKRYDSEEGIL